MTFYSSPSVHDQYITVGPITPDPSHPVVYPSLQGSAEHLASEDRRLPNELIYPIIAEVICDFIISFLTNDSLSSDGFIFDPQRGSYPNPIPLLMQVSYRFREITNSILSIVLGIPRRADGRLSLRAGVILKPVARYLRGKRYLRKHRIPMRLMHNFYWKSAPLLHLFQVFERVASIYHEFLMVMHTPAVSSAFEILELLRYEILNILPSLPFNYASSLRAVAGDLLWQTYAGLQLYQAKMSCRNTFMILIHAMNICGATGQAVPETMQQNLVNDLCAALDTMDPDHHIIRAEYQSLCKAFAFFPDSLTHVTFMCANIPYIFPLLLHLDGRITSYQFREIRRRLGRIVMRWSLENVAIADDLHDVLPDIPDED
ncbi:hypothetical protein K474DRAFT_1666198 [Panus rudis PR-1116 ss-1]|nr:hypothetical protein K474DRAFT_1666198 [Panus rudis PR-1116 ss-1]